MNKLYVFIGAILTVVGAAAPCSAADVVAQAGDAATLKIMTFNLRYGTAPDGENAWPKRSEIVTDCIKEYDPDILGTQECLDFQAEYIAEHLPQYRWIGIGRNKDGKGEMAAVFYKKKDLVPVESGTFWLSETPQVPGSRSWDAAITRIVTWVKFHDVQNDKFLRYFNTHFDHIGIVARQKSAELYRKRVQEMSGDLPVIVTGDFNSMGGQGKVWETMTSGGLRDAWMTADKKEGPETTSSDFKAPDPKSRIRIDWILYNDKLHAKRCETVTYNKGGRYPTDHYPVFAELTW